jgi:hypothetical protein
MMIRLISEKGSAIHAAWQFLAKGSLSLSFSWCATGSLESTGITQKTYEIMDAVEKANAERQRKWYGVPSFYNCHYSSKFMMVG